MNQHNIMNKVLSYCKIDCTAIHLNDALISVNASNTAGLLEHLLQTCNIDYPKIYKMDMLSKLCLLGTELLLTNYSISHVPSFEKSIILMNQSSCYLADIAYQETINDTPSPSKFVYTLPNIAIGEIAIKHKIQGLTSFMITDKFQPEFISQYFNQLLDTKEVSIIIGGWVEVSEEYCDMFLFLCGKSDSGADLTEENLKIKSKL